MTKNKTCDWQIIRSLSFHPPPPCEPAKWKAKISKDVPIFGGKIMHLCDYHKNNLALRYDRVEEICQK